MDRQKAWDKIRESIPGTFYQIAKAKKLQSEIRLSKPVLKAQVNFTPYTELEKYNKELADLDELLESERDFNKVKEQEFTTRWDLAYERQKLLNEAMEKFSVYYEGCQKKIDNDVIRIRTAREEIAEKDREIRKLKKVNEILEELKLETRNRRDLCEYFKDFMNRVVESSGDEYANVPDLIARFKDLKLIRDERVEKTTKCLLEGVEAQELQNKEFQLFHDEEVAYRLHKSRLENYKEQFDTFNGGLNEKVIRVKNECHSKILEMEHSKTSISSLYFNLCKEMNQPAVLKDTDTKEQLEFIKKFLGEMTKMTQKVRETLKGGSDIVVVPDKFNRNRRKSCYKKEVHPRKRSTEVIAVSGPMSSGVRQHNIRPTDSGTDNSD